MHWKSCRLNAFSPTSEGSSYPFAGAMRCARASLYTLVNNNLGVSSEGQSRYHRLVLTSKVCLDDIITRIVSLRHGIVPGTGLIPTSSAVISLFATVKTPVRGVKSR